MHRTNKTVLRAACVAAGIVVAQGATAMGWLFGSDFEGYTPPKASASNIEALKDRVLDDMVFVEGGSFLYGNVPVPVIVDGKQSDELIYGPVVDPDRAPIEIGSYYMSRFEITNYDFDLYAAANDLPLRPDLPHSHERQGPYPAILAYHQAKDYCTWLAEITQQPFSLPNQQQWEYAARSGGQNVAYATQDGAYDYLADLYQETLDQKPHTTHLPDAYPPNPIGLYAMSSNLSEWVLESWADPETGELFPEGFEGDPEQRHRRVWRGSSHSAQASLNSLFLYGAAGILKRDLVRNGATHLEPYFHPDLEQIYWGTDIGARCVVNLPSGPETSTFGRAPGPIPEGFPKAITPLERR